ncbi:hypothetical protein [Legionella nagasakiensis]|uniref:hypothetical protein n=1 Tax=Legionella nagasakiensis TaxID=535290 RepID=UPI0013EFC1C1|nr:hypothetical protein [Legionella nagasakiensis]
MKSALPQQRGHFNQAYFCSVQMRLNASDKNKGPLNPLIAAAPITTGMMGHTQGDRMPNTPASQASGSDANSMFMTHLSAHSIF